MSSAWLVEINGVFERWSQLKEIVVHPKDVTVDIASLNVSGPLQDVVFPKHYRDSYSIRLGSDYQVIPERLTMRAGYIYESSAIPNQYVNVDFIGWGRQVVSAGASVELFGAYVDLGYAHHFIATKQITDSKVEQLTPNFGMNFPASVVGNGTYSAALDVFSVAVRVPFDQVRKRI
jgi:long-subunit fatty acid transport protein